MLALNAYTKNELISYHLKSTAEFISLYIPKDKITPKTLIFEELELDSLDRVDILVWMEKDYGTTSMFDEDEEAKKKFSEIKTIDDLTKFFMGVINKLEEKNGK